MKRLLLFGLLSLAMTACSDRPVTGVVDDAAMVGGQEPSYGMAAASNLKVATVNMYFGAPVEPILDAPEEEIPLRVAEAWAIVAQTDFPARARALAAQLATAKPHLIGLQEVAILRTEEVYDPTSAAETVYLDFLEILLADLEARNVHYVPAVQIVTTDVELPKLDSVVNDVPFVSGVRLTDRDVILVRADVPFTDPFTYYYTAFLGPSFDPSIPIPVDVLRGISAVTATVHGTDFRFVNTHLESEDRGGLFAIRNAQAYELTQVLAATVPSTQPIIVVGDFNSGPGRPVSEGESPTAYELMLGSGFLDAWLLQPGPELPGFTCCHAGDLSNALPMFDQRIDLVFLANMNGLGKQGATPIVQAYLLNDRQQDLKKYGVWFSDHAATVAHIVLPNPQMAMR